MFILVYMSGYVYLIHDEERGLFKIGVTKNDIEKRLKKLQTGNASLLTVKDQYLTEYIYRMETMLHKHFEDKKVLNEWFELTDEDVQHFSDTCDKFENIIHSLLSNPFFIKNLH